MRPCKCPVRIPRGGAATAFKSKMEIIGNNTIGPTQKRCLFACLPTSEVKNAAFNCTQKEQTVGIESSLANP